MFNLEPADIILSLNTRGDLFSRVKRWAIGLFDHIFMYMGELGVIKEGYSGELLNVPMLFESDGRGVVLGSLSSRYGEQVVVMRITELRLKPRSRGIDKAFHMEHISKLLQEAIKLASDRQAYYDYFCVVHSIIPRIIYEKLGIPLELIPGWLRYQRDPYQICSEAILEISTRAGIPFLRDDIVPLPGDFFDSPVLKPVWEGELNESIVK